MMDYPHSSAKYEGHFVDGLKEGFGKYNWADGAWYEGNFEKVTRLECQRSF